MPLLASGYGALYWIANRSVYFPWQYPRGYWDEEDRLHAVDVFLTTPDGIRIHGWRVENHGSGLITLFLHGNAGNITHRVPVVQEIASAGSSVLIIDYRGYGKSTGRPSEKGLYTDAKTAYRYLREQGFQPNQIIIHGESLGTAVAVDLASRDPCAGLVLEAPFSSARAVAAKILPLLGPCLIWCYDSISKIARVRTPVLIIHGDQDQIIPLALGQALFEAAHEPKSMWIIPGAGHNDIQATAGPQYRGRLQAFYEGLNRL